MGWCICFALGGAANVGVLSDVLVCRLDSQYSPISLAVAWFSSDDADVINHC